MRSRSISPDRVPQAGAWAQLFAALLWLPQAGLLAWSIQQLADGATVRAIVPAAVAVIGLGALRAALDAWGLRRLFRAARARLSQLREEAIAALATNSPLDRERPASGLATSAIAEQAEAILPALTRYPPVRLRLMLVPPVLLLAVAWYSWAAAAVLLFAAPMIPLFMVIIGWRARAASEEQMVQMGQMNAFLLDRLRGLRTLRAFGAIDLTAARLRASADDLRRRTMAVLRIAFLSSAVLELFSALGVALVAVYVGFHLLGQIGFGAWGARLSLGEGLFILMLAPAFFEPLRELAAVWHDRAAGTAALAELQRLAQRRSPLVGAAAPPRALQAEVSTERPNALPNALPSALSNTRLAGAAAGPAAAAVAVEIRQLTFGYEDGAAPLFDQFNLTVRAGEHLAITGASGRGKSTLLCLLAGLAAPQGGLIRIGSHLMSGSSAAAARAEIGWMGQDPHVFAGPLRSNITLGRSTGTALVDAAIHRAVLDEVDQARRDAALGEDGSGLSGGERLRLALARLAARPDAGLLLVDEPTAHLDGETARRVIDALLQIAGGRTLIVATHDPAVAARLHRSVDLDAGLDQRRAA